MVNRFSCGAKQIDSFLKNKAKRSNNRYEYRVFCAHIGASKNAIGYYALQIGSESVAALPDNRKDNYLKSYIVASTSHVAFPAVALSFLGVDSKFQRQGLGKHLLMDVFEKVARIAENAGFYALTLVSLDDKSTEFYESIGFSIYSQSIKLPKMLYPLEDILTLVGDSQPESTE